VKRFAAEHSLKLGQIAQPLRAALTGTNTSPGIFDVMSVLGKAETMQRIGRFTASSPR
jgi:glutamyl-tRNA synthetase